MGFERVGTGAGTTLTPEKKSMIAAAMSALSDGHRAEIVELLARAAPRHLPAEELARALRINEAALQRHLSVLRRARLVRETRVGAGRRYSLDQTTTRECLSVIDALARQLGPEG